MSQEKLSVGEKIGYGMGDAASNIVFQSVMMFLAFFYTDIFGISAAAVGTLFLAVRVLDAVTDPLMGALTDRTETRWGKFRPYLLWLAIPYALVCVMAFTTPDFDDTGKLIYAYVTYALLMIMYTAINIPYCALGGVLTEDPQERVSVQSYRFVFAMLGGLIVSALTLPLVDLLGDGDRAKGYQLAIAAMSAVGVAMFFICFATTRERVRPVAAAKTRIREDLAALWQNDQWRIIAFLTFVVVLGIIIRGTVALYYVNYVLNKPNLASAFITTGMLGMLFGAACAKPVTDRYCKIKVYSVCNLLIALLCVAFFFIDSSTFMLAFVLHFVVGFLQQMTSPIIWAMMSDTVDYGEWKTGIRITGMTFSASLFALKMGMAVAGALAGWVLSAYGYQPGAEQSETALYGIVLLFTLIPACGSAVSAMIVRLYKLDTRRVNELHEELHAGATASQPATA